MQTFLIFLHVFVCLLLILVVLLQPGKSPGMGGAFGGAASSGSFGAKSPTTILSKITVAMATGFMLSSLTLAWLSVRDHSVRLDFDEDTHHPTHGLALPGDLTLPQEDVDSPETGMTIDGPDGATDPEAQLHQQDPASAPDVEEFEETEGIDQMQ